MWETIEEMNRKLANSNPCRHCEERTMVCHSLCESYKEWSEAVELDRTQKHEDAVKRNKTFPSSIYKKIKAK